MPTGSVGLGTEEEQQCAATSSPFGLFLNVPWDPLSCVSGSLGASGSQSGRVALVLFSAKRPLGTSSTPVTSKRVISLPELRASLADEACSSAL